MPTYDFCCQNGHYESVFEAISAHRDVKPCGVCALESRQQYSAPPGLVGGQMTDATRKLLEVPFGRKAAQRMLYVSDVDSKLHNIEKKYGLFGKGVQSGADDKGL